jgi:hypothetical protein
MCLIILLSINYLLLKIVSFCKQQIELPHILRRFFEVPHIFLTVICHGILKKSFLHFEMIVSTGFVYCTRINVWKLKESPLTRVECVEAQTDSPKKSVFGDC